MEARDTPGSPQSAAGIPAVAASTPPESDAAAAAIVAEAAASAAVEPAEGPAMKPEVAADAAAEIAMVPAEIPGETASPPEAGTPAEESPAAAGLGGGGGGGGGDEAKEYRLKDIQWVDAATGREREVKIATQNENGPCPLLALANVLALTGRVQLGRAAQRTASGGELAAAVANLLLDQPGGSSSGDAQAVLTLLPRLHTGLDVDLRFSHVRGFAPTPGARLFAAFGVPLVHGWVVDPQADPAVARALAGCGDSYEGAVEYVLAADELSSSVIGGGGSAAAGGGELDAAQQQRVCDAAAVHEWLQATATQLTDRGLQMLQAELAPGSLSVLFRNNHFSTLLRHADGRLFVLCTDDVVAAEPRLVWESLADVRQARSHFVDSRFRPLDAHAAGDYARQGNAAANTASHEQAQADQIDSDFALALRLHEEEEEERRRRHRQQTGGLQVRQHDRPPPGMDVRPGDPLFNVPEVTRDGESRLARAMHRSRSDDSFGRQMQAAFLPNEAARPARPPRQQQQRQRPPPPPPAQDRCIIT